MYENPFAKQHRLKCSKCGKMYALSGAEYARASLKQRSTCPDCLNSGGPKKMKLRCLRCGKTFSVSEAEFSTGSVKSRNTCPTCKKKEWLRYGQSPNRKP